jgi:hypothetical protein
MVGEKFAQKLRAYADYAEGLQHGAFLDASKR